MARYQAVCKLRIGQVGSLAHIFGYAGVDEENLQLQIHRIDTRINNLARLISDREEDAELINPVVAFLNELRNYLTSTEAAILHELSEGGEQ